MSGIVGLIPAAGQSQRLAPLPMSKELFPIGFQTVEAAGQPSVRPKPVSLYLVERMALAGLDRLLMVIGREKFDIVRYFGSRVQGIPVGYVVQDNARGMPFALDLAAPWLSPDDTVLFGMPDTIFFPMDAFPRLLAAHKIQNADITLGLFPTNKPERFGMVDFDASGRMTYTVDKPAKSNLTYMWGIGCWNAAFASFMSKHLAQLPTAASEVVLGHVFQAALENGLNIRVLPFDGGEYIDMGAPDDLAAAIRRFSADSEPPILKD